MATVQAWTIPLAHAFTIAIIHACIILRILALGHHDNFIDGSLGDHKGIIYSVFKDDVKKKRVYFQTIVIPASYTLASMAFKCHKRCRVAA